VRERLDHAEALVASALAEVSDSLLGDDEVIESLGLFEQVGRLVDAGRVAIAAEVEKRSDRSLGEGSLAWKRGCRTGSDLIAQVTRVSGAEARRRVRLGARTRARQELTGVLPPLFPAVASALAAGELGVDAAEVITSGLEMLSARAEVAKLQGAERALVSAATGRVTPETVGLPYAGFAFAADLMRGQVHAWQLRLDPDGTVPTENGREARSSIGFGRFRDGRYPLRGGVTPAVRGVMDGLFGAHISARAPLPGNGGPQTGAGAGQVRFPTEQEQALVQERIDAGELIPGADQILDDRTGGEKRADILRMIFDTAARLPETPTMGGAAPTVTVHVNAADLTAGQGGGWADGVEAPVSLRTVRQMMCAGGYEEVIFSENGNILRWGGKQRCFTPQQRKALIARDGDTCIIPGCPIPARWCEAHHVIAWQQNHETRIENGVLLCWYHHHTIHTSGWEIRMKRGRPEVKAPPWIDHTNTWRPAASHRATTATAAPI
jgi:hypothetical protein